MLPVWILAPLAAWAGPPESPPEPALSTHAVEVDGVEFRPTARELVRSNPRGLQFEVKDKPAIEDGRLVVEGVLENPGSREVTVYLATDRERDTPFALVPRGATYERELPPGRRSPAELVLPPGGKAIFRSALVLEDWSWPDDGAEIDWVLHYWKGEEKGSLTGKLSPP